MTVTFTCEIEGIDELVREHHAACDDLDRDLRDASLAAAAAGVKQAQEQHPYTDRTYQLTETAHAEPSKDTSGEDSAEMVWSKEYASYVDKGTGRSAPYPFTPQARERAASSLDRGAEQAVKKLEDRMNR